MSTNHNKNHLLIESVSVFSFGSFKINDMDFELSKFGPNSRSSMSNKLKQYKLDVELIQKDLVIKKFSSKKKLGFF
jgi:hypothetical protein